MRAWLARSKAVHNYAALCPDKLEQADTDNVKKMLKQHGPFIYGDSEFESKLGEREQRD
jgi:hypothetical protein